MWGKTYKSERSNLQVLPRQGERGGSKNKHTYYSNGTSTATSFRNYLPSQPQPAAPRGPRNPAQSKTPAPSLLAQTQHPALSTHSRTNPAAPWLCPMPPWRCHSNSLCFLRTQHKPCPSIPGDMLLPPAQGTHQSPAQHHQGTHHNPQPTALGDTPRTPAHRPGDTPQALIQPRTWHRVPPSPPKHVGTTPQPLLTHHHHPGTCHNPLRTHNGQQATALPLPQHTPAP